MLPFVGIALRVCEKMEMVDKRSQSMVMKFAKIYSVEKMGKIVEVAQAYTWWRSNPIAAFMKAVGQVNREEKEAKLK